MEPSPPSLDMKGKGESMRVNEINDIQTYLKQIGQYELLTPEQEKELFTRLKDGDTSAKEEIIQKNLKLVVAIAKKYKGTHLSFMDLVQEGTFGLIAAVDKFDISLGFKFSTYATYWIRQAISKAIVNKGRIIRLPAHINNKLSKVKQTSRALALELRQEPTEAQIAERMGITEQEVKDLLDMDLSALSLDAPVGDDDDGTIGDFIEDTRFESPVAAAAKKDLKDQLYKVMDSLEEREKEVLIKRYGLENDNPMTLEEVGKSMNLSRERIRQIEEKALRKMRNPIRSEQLKIYMADAA